MKNNIFKTLGIMFYLGLFIALFPTQTFAQEVQPIKNESQDQMIEEEINTDITMEEEIVEPKVEEPVVEEDELVIEQPVQEDETIIEQPVEEDELAIEQPVEEDESKTIVHIKPLKPTMLPKNLKKVVNISASIESNTYNPVVYPHYLDLGYVGEIENAILYDHFTTKNYTRFEYAENPFMKGQCTWFAWSRFYQIYGFDSGARGNGKTNALEIVEKHEDKFELSSTPAAGAVFSMEENTLYPEYGHTGFVEAYDGEYVWISEGNVKFGLDEGNIWIHKVKWNDFKKQYPDVVFAVPKVNDKVKECFMDVHKTFLFFCEKKEADYFDVYPVYWTK